MITIERSFCDVCGKEVSGYSNCDHCGKEYCYECSKTELKEYKHSVYCSGSGDGNYCHKCDAELIASGDKKHIAYRNIANLRNENRGWNEDFKRRSDAAESELSKLQEDS